MNYPASSEGHAAAVVCDSRTGRDTSWPPRPRVLIVQDYYLPGEKCGGPVWAIANMVERLGDRFEFLIAAVNRDINSATPYPGILPNTWKTVGKARVFYASKLSYRTLRRLIRQCAPHVLHLNGFFCRTTMKAVISSHLHSGSRIPVVLAPHGEFSEGALGLKSIRKRAYISLARKFSLYSKVLWQASSAWEEKDIRRTIGEKCNIHIAPDVPSPSEKYEDLQTQPPPKSPDHLRLVFLSRVTPQKNLCRAIEMLQGVRGKIEFDIFGPIEDAAYWQKCLEAIGTLPPWITVRYCGLIPHERVLDVLSQYHLFFLPTLGENFGYAILEALTAGCPVLISDRTPWRNLSAQRVGWDLPLEKPEAWQTALRQAAAMDGNTYATFSSAARKLALEWICSPNLELPSVELFRRALETHHPHACSTAGNGARY